MKRYIFESSHGPIRVYVKDNGAKTTLLFVHGLNSGGLGLKNVWTLKTNFNIVAFDFPTTGSSLKQYVEILDEISRDFLVGKNFVYMGHSFGALVCLSATEREKMGKLFLFSPVNPSLSKTINYSIFAKAAKIEQRIRKAGMTAIERGSKIAQTLKQKSFMRDFFRDGDYKTLMDEHLMNREFLQNDLHALYKKYKAYYAIGSMDTIIPTRAFVDYVLNELESEVRVFKWARHSPYKDTPQAVVDYLNSYIPYEKRFFMNRFFTLKKAKFDKNLDMVGSTDTQEKKAQGQDVLNPLNKR